MNNSALITWVREQLGDPVIDVELTNSQIQKCIDDALKRWCKRVPTEKIGSLIVVAGVQKYTPASVGNGIIKVSPEPFTQTDLSSEHFDIFRDRVWTYSSFDLSDLALLDIYLETLRQVSSTEFDWLWDPVEGDLYIAPVPTYSYRLMYVYVDLPTVDQATAKYDWVQDYALAKAKGILGLIRRKHGDRIPGSESETTLDGAALIQESAEAVRDLNEKLLEINKSATPPMVAG